MIPCIVIAKCDVSVQLGSRQKCKTFHTSYHLFAGSLPDRIEMAGAEGGNRGACENTGSVIEANQVDCRPVLFSPSGYLDEILPRHCSLLAPDNIVGCQTFCSVARVHNQLRLGND